MNTSIPEIRIFAWDIDEIASPVGSRHIPGGSFAFKNVVSSGCSTFDPNNSTSTSGILLFENVTFDLTNTLPSHVESKVAAITFNLASSGSAISDMKLFVSDDSAFQASSDEGLDRAFIQYAASGSFWAYKGIMPSGSVDRLPLVVPTEPNIFRQDKTAGLVGQDDLNSSEFIYLNVVMPLGTKFGNYGVCGSGLLRLGLTFNYWCNDFVLQFGGI